MNRSLRLRIGALAVAAVALGACSETSSSGSSGVPAATVGGVDITAAELVDELEAIGANTDYVTAYEEAMAAQGGVAILAGDRQGDEFTTQFTTETLAIRIQYAMVTAEAASRDLDTGGACHDAARAELIARFTPTAGGADGEAILAGFGADYEGYLVDRHASFLALQADLAGASCGGEPDEAAIEAYFEEHRDELTAEVACVSHILVATLAEAEELQAELAGGADFAQLATEHSTDTGSGAAGGELGCTAAGQFVEAFDAVAFSAPVGEISDPVETEFGFHLILVTERSTPTFDDVRDQVVEAIRSDGELAFSAWFEEELASTEVVIDPRYGTWDPSTAAIVAPAPTGPVIVDSGEE